MRPLNWLRSAIRSTWADTVARARTRGARLPIREFYLLGSSRKVEKGARLGVRSAVLYLAPSVESGRNVCAHATEGCASACLGHNSGQLAMSASENARAWKTALFFGNRFAFLELARREIATLERRARRERTIPAVRLDGSSDLGIGPKLAPEFPNVQFWDYTKNVGRALRALDGGYGPNVHVTFSRSGENDTDVSRVLSAGGAVAVVFNARPGSIRRAADPLPDTWTDPVSGRAFRVVDGDESDARFLDRRAFGLEPGEGYVVGLRFKAAADRAGHLDGAGSFVVDVETAARLARVA